MALHPAAADRRRVTRRAGLPVGWPDQMVPATGVLDASRTGRSVVRHWRGGRGFLFDRRTGWAPPPVAEPGVCGGARHVKLRSTVQVRVTIAPRLRRRPTWTRPSEWMDRVESHGAPRSRSQHSRMMNEFWPLREAKGLATRGVSRTRLGRFPSAYGWCGEGGGGKGSTARPAAGHAMRCSWPSPTTAGRPRVCGVKPEDVERR
jgi:hypothetical protein